MVMRYNQDDTVPKIEPYDVMSGATDTARGLNKDDLYTIDEFIQLVNDIQKAEAAKQSITWFSCDKGWFGVEVQYHRRAFDHINMAAPIIDGEAVHSTPILFRVMAWAESNNIPYEISTVTPDVVAQQQFRVALANEKLAKKRAAAESLANGFDAKPKFNHRIEAIREMVNELHKQYVGVEKPIKFECFNLLCQIAKYIVEQADEGKPGWQI